MQPLQYYFQYPNQIGIGILTRLGACLPDKLYLIMMYRLKMGRKLNLEHPKSFSEKIQWLKLYDRKPKYTLMVDKYAAKQYVSQIIGSDYVIPTLGVWDKPKDIEWDLLPDKFVLKTTHGGGGTGVVICKDKKKINMQDAMSKLNNSLKHSIYATGREWPYKNVTPKILAEELLEDNGAHGLMDYKVFCCNGEPKCIKVNYDTESNYHVNWYTTDWNYIEGTTIYDPTDPNVQIDKPKELDSLLELSSKLSKGIPFLRVDFYITEKGLKFGELTFSPGGGFERFDPESFDLEIGSWIQLPD